MIGRKRVDFTQFEFPEVNPIDLRLPSYNKRSEIRLANYRWPAEGTKKGVVHYIHGYGDYVGRYGYLAKAFAQRGFDFCGID